MEHPQHSSEHAKHAPAADGKHASGAVPREAAIHRVWKRFRLAHGFRPVLGAAVVGGAALAIAVQFGAPEFLVGASAAYMTYRMLRYGIGLKEALTESIKIEEVAAMA